MRVSAAVANSVKLLKPQAEATLRYVGKDHQIQTGEFVDFDDARGLKTALEEHSAVVVSLHLHAQHTSFGFTVDGRELEVAHFEEINVNQLSNTYRLRHISAGKVIIRSFGAELENVDAAFVQLSVRSGPLTLKNCRITTLVLSFQTEPHSETLKIEDCQVFGLYFSNRPSHRSAILEGSSFGREPREKGLFGALKEVDPHAPRVNRETFSMLLNWAEEAGNASIAHLARGYELALDAKVARGWAWVILNLWGLFSDYGLSSMRPLIWAFGASFAVFVSLLVSGTSVGVPVTSLVGWRENLISTADYDASLARALVGTFETLLSPLSNLGVRALVVPDQGWMMVVKVLHGYFMLAMLFLFGFSLRRRLRML